MSLLVRSRIPGKVMIAGEYDVLRGGLAVSATVNLWLTVESQVATPQDLTCTVKSSLWSEPKLLDYVNFQPLASTRQGDQSNKNPSDQITPPVRDILLQSIISSCQRLLQPRQFNQSNETKQSDQWSPKFQSQVDCQVPFREVRVTSDFPPAWGLGSSSALRLGVCRNALYLHLYRTDQLSRSACLNLAHQEAWHQQLSCQTQASGYDIATQVAGGVCLYKLPHQENSEINGKNSSHNSRNHQPALQVDHWPSSATKQLPPNSVSLLNQHICLLVGGRGAPTGQTMASTRQWLDAAQRWQTLRTLSARCTDSLIEFCQTERSDHRQQVIQALKAHSEFFSSSPQFPVELMKQFYKIPGYGESWAIKTTGAGGEDALLYFGSKDGLTALLEMARQCQWHCIKEPFQSEGATTTIEQFKSLGATT